VAAGIEKHPFEQEPIGGLNLGALGDRHSRGPKALGQFVAHALELAQVEQPWLGMSPVKVLEPSHRICGHERVGQLALELCDL
jgi:hypothetical protein